jgi:uncharacterized protein (DUF924 family)
MSPDPRAAAFLDYWFAPGMDARWFAADSALDRDLAIRFGDLLTHATRGELESWVDDADSALALVIVLDQLPRNVFRGTWQAFAFDSRALAMAEAALLRGHHLRLPPMRRRFLYLPFEHSESLPDQTHCVALFEADGGDPAGLDWARQHRDVIARFGRFPHRNAVLGRDSTVEEEAWLAQPGNGW